MYKTFSFVCVLSFVSFNGYSQHKTLNAVLQDIEHNNTTLKSYAYFLESKRYTNSSENNLQDPQFSMYYLPWGSTQEGTYNEFQLSQQFDFPTVYSKRKTVNQIKTDRHSFLLAAKRQEILLEAKTVCLSIVYLDNQMRLEKTRLTLAQTLYNQHQDLYKANELTILDLNKSKINWLQCQSNLQKLNVESQNKWSQLNALNNQINFAFNEIDFQPTFNLPTLDDLWKEKNENDPELLELSKNTEIAHNNIDLQKAKGLPKITLGINRQSIPNSSHFGIFTGLSLPLWENNHKIKSVKRQLKSVEELQYSRTQQLYSALEQSYNTYESLLKKYSDYKHILKDMDNEALLLKSYQLGELSFTAYYLEIQFFRNVKNTFLELEHQLLKLKAELLKHQL